MLHWILEWLYMVKDRWLFGNWDTRTIYLSTGQQAIVDAEDYPHLSTYNWRLNRYQRFIRVTRCASVNGQETVIQMARAILNPLHTEVVLHLNRNKLDCRKENLVACQYTQLHQYMQKRIGISGYRGVSEYRGRWRATIRVNGVRHWLGDFKEKLDAALAYDSAARLHFGRFAQVNFKDRHWGQGG